MSMSPTTHGGYQVPMKSENNSAGRGYSTFHFQKELPELPIPALQSTGEKLLSWSRPLLTADEYAETESAVREFLRPGGDGEKIQQALIDWSALEEIENWLEPFWDDIYLKNREPVAVNITPFFLFRDLGMGQFESTAVLIRAGLEFKKLVDAESLPVEFEHAKPLCMMPYKRIFSTERVPGVERDELRSPLSEGRNCPSEAIHIVVMHRGNMYRLDVFDADGNPLEVDQIKKGLQAVVEISKKAGPNPDAPGVLTGMERTPWALAREELRETDPVNAASLDTVEKALFAVALEEKSPADTLEMIGDLLHGEPGNRWYDKSFTFIAYPKGRLGLSLEHAGLDGTTVINMITRVFQIAEEFRAGAGAEVAAPVTTAANNATEIKIEPVVFVVNQSVKTAIRAAAEGYKKLAESTAIEILDFRAFGKDLIKTFGVSPDGFIQSAFHLAQRRSWGYCGSTYESAMTRRYRHGRTEALRTVTPEVTEFVEAMESDPIQRKDTQDKLKRAAAAHVIRMKECKEGQGVERHMLGLFSIWQRRGQDLGIGEEPEIFRSPGWNRLRYDILSTSRLASDDVEYFGFGPTTPDCTGIGYAVHGNNCVFVISAKAARSDQLKAFTRNLNQALLDMAELMGKMEYGSEEYLQEV